MLSFTLLGQVSLSQNQQPLDQFRSQKEAALLIYLAHTGQTHSREHIADLLWESSSTKQALSNLRTVLTRLRKQVGDELIVTRKTLALTSESLQTVDSACLLRALVELGQIDSAEEADTLQAALDTYRGEFLADFTLPDAPRFEAWMATTREQIHRQLFGGYRTLGQYTLANNKIAQGITVAQRWLQVDDLSEEAHALLIQLLIADGQTHEALAQYDDCVTRLHDELGVAPSAELNALIQAARATPADIEPSAVSLQPLTSSYQPPTSLRHNLPPVYDEFFGRVDAQRTIQERLTLDWCRLVTIVGPGGVGKTRLATTVARNCLAEKQNPQTQTDSRQGNQGQGNQEQTNQGTRKGYPDGIWLIELADIDPEDHDLTEAIAVEIATALDLRLSGADKPIDQLLSFLQHKAMLMVLDNFEHLLEGGIAIVGLILERCEGIQLMVTSREALRIRAEWTIALKGLDYPASAQLESPADDVALGGGEGRTDNKGEEKVDDKDELRTDALDLFVARYAQYRPGAIVADELAAMAQICRMVEGLPLAIELAAALTHAATPQTVADNLRNGFDALQTKLRDVPQRHRSLRMVFEMSWETLTLAVQQRLAKLSVFRGGFTEDAAIQIAGANIDVLAMLTEKLLLAHDAAAGRYLLHAVVRAYASEKWAEEGTAPKLVEVHARYYLALLAEHAEPLQKNAPQESIAVLEPDIANVRLAWQRGLGDLACSNSPKGRGREWSADGAEERAEPNEIAELLYAALPSLSVYYQLRGLAYEAEEIMSTTFHAAAKWGENGVALATRAVLERARFQNRLSRYQPAIETVETALTFATRHGDSWAEGMGHVLWGESLWRTGEYDLAAVKLNHALSIAEVLNDSDNTCSTQLRGWCHHHLGVINDIQGCYDAAHDHLQQACDAWRKLDNAHALNNSLNSVGIVLYNHGDLPKAQQTMANVLALCEQLDNRHLKSVLLNNLSLIATEQGDYLSAHHYLKLGLDLATQHGNLTSQGEIYSNMGKNYHLLGQMDLAIQNLEQSLQISESIGNSRLTAETMLNIAESKRKQSDDKQAEYWYSEALAIARQRNLRRAECEALIGIAEVLGENQEQEALQHSAEATALAESLRNPDLLERSNAIHHYWSISADINEYWSA